MASIPKTARQIIVHTIGSKFREVTEVKECPIPELTPKSVLVKIKFVGVNASDINFTSGRYFTDAKPPFPCGFEGIGEVVAVGAESKHKVGTNVAVLSYGAFAEYFKVDDDRAFPIPACDPGFISLLISGPTASISLEKYADLKAGDTVLVTAAAGGTGMFAVQWAKLAGCTVIGTCSSKEKADFLKSIGCDRPVNYNEENLNDVLKKEFPNGVNVVYECIGGEMFDAALENLANFGRFIVIGQISKYGSDELTKALTKPESKLPIAMTLLRKNAMMKGFILTNYRDDTPGAVAKLAGLYAQGKIKVATDNGASDPKGPFKGLDKVADAIDYMYSKKNTGKIVVEL